jgi:hypothetical protein
MMVVAGGPTASENLSQNAVNSYALSQKGWYQILKKTELNQKHKDI